MNTNQEAVEKSNKALKELQDKLRLKQEELRNDPRKLSAAIAEEIRLDIHANENPANYKNSVIHWFQNEWGSFRASAKNLVKLGPIIGWGNKETTKHSYFEVVCPTTGCVAGHAAVLAGFPMVYNNVDLSPLEAFGTDEIIPVQDCYDPENKEIRSIVDVGRELLQLGSRFGSRQESWKDSWLFDGTRHEQQVLWALDRIAAGEEWRSSECPFDDEGEERYGKTSDLRK